MPRPRLECIKGGGQQSPPDDSPPPLDGELAHMVLQHGTTVALATAERILMGVLLNGGELQFTALVRRAMRIVSNACAMSETDR